MPNVLYISIFSLLFQKIPLKFVNLLSIYANVAIPQNLKAGSTRSLTGSGYHLTTTTPLSLSLTLILLFFIYYFFNNFSVIS